MKYIIGVRTLQSLQKDYGNVSIDEAINAFEKEYYETFASMYTDKTWLDIRAIMSMSGSLDALSELVPRMRMLLRAPGSPPRLMSKPAICP